MPDTLDLNLLPLYRLNGQELPSLPGLLAVSPPRKVARGREDDRLVVYLTLSGNNPVSTAEYMQVTARAAESFYQSSGSLTAAMRSAAEALNRSLLDRNLRTTGRGQYITGWLVMAAMRGNQLTLLQSGPVHIFWLGKGETSHLFDPQLSGRGLGLSQSASLHFSQVDLQAGDRLVLCGQIPPGWEQTLLQDRSPASLEATRRRLLLQAPPDLNAVLLQAQAGEGQVYLLRMGKPEAGAPAARPASTASAPSAATPGPAKPAPIRTVGRPDVSASGERPLAAALSRRERTFPPSIPRARPPSEEPTGEAGPPPLSEIKATPAPRLRQTGRQAARGLASLLQGFRRMTAAVGRGLGGLLPRLMPSSGERSLSSGLMLAFIAVAVPVVVVTVASLVYLRYGRNTQYQTLYAMAETSAERAIGQADPLLLRMIWTDTLDYLNQAEQFQITPQSQALREHAQTSLDGLLGITRLEYQLAIVGGLPRGVQISRLAASETDLYLLEALSGSLLRAYLTGRGYELDDNFRCGPGEHGGVTVGGLVDLIIPPRAIAQGASVLAVDDRGTLLYCAAGEDPVARPLALPPTNWSRPTGFVLDETRLYALDAPARALWIYFPDSETKLFSEPPVFYFSGQIPRLDDVIDLAVNGDDLFLLHSDGRLTVCNSSLLSDVPTRCSEPAYVDQHPAAQGSDPFTGITFGQMQYTYPPDSSLLMLNGSGQSLYRFSPRSLELQSQWHPAAGDQNLLPPVPATAMTLSPNHILFLALGDQVYLSVNVP